jgi:hypothetical protein
MVSGLFKAGLIILLSTTPARTANSIWHLGGITVFLWSLVLDRELIPPKNGRSVVVPFLLQLYGQPGENYGDA